MKKQVLVVSSALLLFGCGNQVEEQQQEEVKQEQALPTVELPNKEIGEGSIELFNASGSTENGQPITIYYNPDVIEADFELVGMDFNGELLSYIYVDNVEVESKQVGLMSQIQIDVPDSILSKTGLHTVTVAQYPDNDTTQEPVTIKTKQFEVKPK